MSKQVAYCRYAPSLGAFEGTPEEVWGTPPYEMDTNSPTVYFGLYGLPDFYSLWRHKGEKFILWAGSDIIHFRNGYWLDDKGKIRVDPKPLAKWISQNCDSWVENEVEQAALNELGIKATICPSFMGNKDEYPVTFVPSERPKVYLSVSGDYFEEYGWNLIEEIADKCEVDFHLFGNSKFETKHPNVFVRGRVPKEQMNEEIQGMQCGLRLNKFDGFSEVTAKSVLWGQYPITRKEFGYLFIDSFKTNKELIDLLNDLKNKTQPNHTARNYYLMNINQFPWKS